MFYVPIDNLNDYCVVVQDKDTIRAIEKNDVSGIYEYKDFFVNSHYLYKTGYLNDISSYNCLNNITNNWYYRNDLSDIFIICFIGALFIIGLPLVIFSRIFPRFRR